LKKIDLNDFLSDLQDESLYARCALLNDAEAIVQCINMSLGKVLDSHAPERFKQIVDRPNTPWYSPELRKMKREVRKLEKRWRKSKAPEDEQIYKARFGKMVNLVRSTKQSFLKKEIEDNSYNPKALYRLVNKLTNPVCNYLPTASMNASLANEFVEFFDSKIKKIRQNLATLEYKVDGIPVPDDESCTNVKFIMFNEISESSVNEVIGSMPNKYCDLDVVPTHLLKQCLPVLLPVITLLINIMLSTGVFPKSLKYALLIPLLKKMGLDIEVKNNYRPISNLAFLSKVGEKCAQIQFLSFLKENNLFDPFQSAYLKHHSTETALLKVHNDIMMSLDEGKPIILLLLDLSAAFDTVDHSLLLNRLNRMYGVGGTALKWFRSYLSDRVQCVKIGNYRSVWKPLSCGVPQGSILGPLLFTLYIGPLGKIVSDCGLQYHIYADDTQLYLGFPCETEHSITSSLESVENCVAMIKCWMNRNFLKLNDSKSELIFLHRPSEESKVLNRQLVIGDHLLKSSSPVRNLGVLFDCGMSLENNINKVVSTCFNNIRKIYRIRSFLNEHTAKCLTHSLIVSHLDYANSLYYNLPKRLLNKLERVQNAAVRLIFQLDRKDHVTELKMSLHWLPVEARVEFKILTLTYKAITGDAPPYLCDMICVVDKDEEKRYQYKKMLVTKDYNYKKYGLRCFSRCAPVLWNALPPEIRLASTFPAFKSGLKTFLFKRTYDTQN